jgi:tyrosyl-tRNA synthetase
MSQPTIDVLAELSWRGMIHQQTDEAGLREHLRSPGRLAYVGYDPTADSLTIGNLVTIMLLAHWQRAGHKPVVLAGGGTGLIGDPSGKTAERELRTKDQVAANVRAQMRIFGRLLDFSDSTPNHAVIVNNLDWLGPISFLDALRDIGKHFSVNMMIQKDSVRERLHNRDQGISYTEFSYMLLQAYDFHHLHKHMGVTLQMGGSDQWGNIVGGVDLIRRMSAAGTTGSVEGSSPVAFGLTTPLVTKSDGTKFGKTESGAIWLTADRTSPYAYYQFWLNAADADVERFLKVFTFCTKPEIEAAMAQQAASPGLRPAQRLLARAATDLLHGSAAREQAERAAAALFSGEVADLPLDVLNEALAAAPSSTHDKAALAGEGLPLVDLLAQTSLASSKGQAKQSLQEGSVSLNGRKVGPNDRATAADLLHGSVIALRRGKKNWHVTRWA